MPFFGPDANDQSAGYILCPETTLSPIIGP